MIPDEHRLFLAKYRWVFLEELHALRDGTDGSPLDDPDQLLDSTERLGEAVRNVLAEMKKAVRDVDAGTVRQIARDVVKQNGRSLLG